MCVCVCLSLFANSYCLFASLFIAGVRAQPSVLEFFPVWLLQNGIYSFFCLPVIPTISLALLCIRCVCLYLALFFLPFSCECMTFLLNTFHKITHKRKLCTTSSSSYSKKKNEQRPCFGKTKRSNMKRSENRIGKKSPERDTAWHKKKTPQKLCAQKFIVFYIKYIFYCRPDDSLRCIYVIDESIPFCTRNDTTQHTT